MFCTILSALILCLPTQTEQEFGVLRSQISQRWSLRELTRVENKDGSVTFKPGKTRILVTFNRNRTCRVLTLDTERTYSFEIADQAILLKTGSVLHFWVILDIFCVQRRESGLELAGVLMYSAERGEFLLSNSETPIRLPSAILKRINRRGAKRSRDVGRRLVAEEKAASAIRWLRKSMGYQPAPETCELLAEAYRASDDPQTAAEWKKKAARMIQDSTKEFQYD